MKNLRGIKETPEVSFGNLFAIWTWILEICAGTDVRTASSVGLEHYFDRVGVTGSNPVQSTTNQLRPARMRALSFYFEDLRRSSFLMSANSRPVCPATEEFSCALLIK